MPLVSDHHERPTGIIAGVFASIRAAIRDIEQARSTCTKRTFLAWGRSRQDHQTVGTRAASGGG